MGLNGTIAKKGFDGAAGWGNFDADRGCKALI
jgi:hypothetical protein